VTNEEAHRYARDKGASRVLVAITRGTFGAWLRFWFRVRLQGTEHVPAEGPAIIAPNHKSFLDPFFVALGTRRRMNFMAKTELIEGSWGWLLLRLGAFPVRRGQSDADALETARTILRNGGLLCMFPEGTRVSDQDTLGPPRRGVARLALDTGAPIVPAAISGTDRLWLGPIPKPKVVRVAYSPPVAVESLVPTPEVADEVIQHRVWPKVESSFRDLARHPGLITAALTAIGIGGGLAVRSQRRRRQPTGIRKLLPRKK
jgi:1-acyl-sn-glycerol-3-phosphate acyltransferase